LKRKKKKKKKKKKKTTISKAVAYFCLSIDNDWTRQSQNPLDHFIYQHG